MLHAFTTDNIIERAFRKAQCLGVIMLHHHPSTGHRCLTRGDIDRFLREVNRRNVEIRLTLRERNSKLTSAATNLQNVSVCVLFQVPVRGPIPRKLQGIRTNSSGGNRTMPSVVFVAYLIVHYLIISDAPIIIVLLGRWRVSLPPVRILGLAIEAGATLRGVMRQASWRGPVARARQIGVWY
jgi:hypothetical protein